MIKIPELQPTAGNISLLTHMCIPVALNIDVHPKLTYELQITILSGIAHPTLQPQLFRFLQTLARFKFSSRHGISCSRAEGRSCPFSFSYNELSHNGHLLVSNDS